MRKFHTFTIQAFYRLPVFLLLSLIGSDELSAQGTILANGARDIGVAGPAYEHPRLFWAASDKAAMLARRTDNLYHTQIATPKINATVNAALTGSYATLADKDLSTPDWAFIETWLTSSEGRNQSWGIASTEAWLTDNAALKAQMIKIITNYARMLHYGKGLADGDYDTDDQDPVNDPSSTLISDVNSHFGSQWTVTEQWRSGGAGFALSYDVLYNDMTIAERDLVRSAIAVTTEGRQSYGMDQPKGRAISNHYGYHGELAVMLLAIKDETGYDAACFSRIRQVLLDYWEVGVTDEGVFHEDTYGANLGMREGTRGLMALARNDASDNIFITDKYKRFCDAMAQQIEPYVGGYMTGGASGTDLSNYPGASENIYPSSLIMIKFFRPNDPVADFIWRWVIGENYGNTIKIQSVTEYSLFGLEVDSSFSAPNTLDGDGLPLTHFYPRRGKLVTRSDWSQDALYFQLDARPDAFMIGHDKVDRGNFRLTALSESWAINPPWDKAKGSIYQTLVHVDGIAQAWKAPSVTFLEHADDGEFVTAASDLKYAYDWEWSPPWPNSSTTYPAPWEHEPNSPIQLGWPADDNPDWLPDTIYGTANVGYVGSYMWRKPYNVMEKVFRSSVLARGTHPYVLIIDDIKKDSSAHDYRWQMALPDDVQIDSQSGRDIILGRAADPTGAKLLVRVIEANNTAGITPATITGSLSASTVSDYDSNVLHISMNSIDPKFKVLLFPFPSGGSLPSTQLAGDLLSIDLPDNTSDVLSFFVNAQGRTEVDVNGVPPGLTLTPNQLSFDVVKGYTPASAQTETFNLSSNLDISQNWTASSDQSWLSLSITSGSLATGANVDITASLASAAYSLSAGEHIAKVTIDSDQDAFDRELTVIVTVIEPFSVNPATADFIAVTSDVQPLTQLIAIDSNAPISQDWTASSNQTWLSLSSSAGTLTANGTNSLTLTVDSEVYGYAEDTYTATITLTSDIGGATTQIPVTLVVTATTAIPTEDFSAFDLDNKQLTFVPVGDSYRVYIDSIAELPNTPQASDELSGNAPISDYGGRDDAYWTFTPTWANLSQIAGQSIGASLHIATNGLISFDSTPLYKWSHADSGDHFLGHQISALIDDLDATTNGKIYYSFSAGDRAIITFIGLSQYSSSDSNTFQVEIFDDGSDIVRISYLQVDANDVVVGISSGTGTPTDWPTEMINFSSLSPFPIALPELSLELIDAQTSEWSSPSDSALLRILSDTMLSDDLSINLALGGTATADDYTGTLTTGSHTFAAGLSQFDLSAQAINDSTAEGLESLQITLQPGTGYTIGSTSIVSINVIDTPYDHWRHTNNEVTILEIDDSDGDGVPALVEYALGTDLHTPDQGYSMAADMSGKTVTITLTNPTPEDVSLTAQWSTNLSTWKSDNVSINGQIITVTNFTGDAIFIKLVATENP